MTDRVHVASTDELRPGEREIVATEAGSVGVFNVDGEFYAIENRCAHQGGPVATGKQQGALEGEFTASGERVREFFDDGTPAIACPWHGWEYDLRTGDHLGDSEFRIETFDVAVEDGEVYVEL